MHYKIPTVAIANSNNKPYQTPYELLGSFSLITGSKLKEIVYGDPESYLKVCAEHGISTEMCKNIREIVQNNTK